MAIPCFGYCVHLRHRYDNATQELEEINSQIHMLEESASSQESSEETVAAFIKKYCGMWTTGRIHCFIFDDEQFCMYDDRFDIPLLSYGTWNVHDGDMILEETVFCPEKASMQGEPDGSTIRLSPCKDPLHLHYFETNEIFERKDTLEHELLVERIVTLEDGTQELTQEIQTETWDAEFFERMHDRTAEMLAANIQHIINTNG